MTCNSATNLDRHGATHVIVIRIFFALVDYCDQSERWICMFGSELTLTLARMWDALWSS